MPFSSLTNKKEILSNWNEIEFVGLFSLDVGISIVSFLLWKPSDLNILKNSVFLAFL